MDFLPFWILLASIDAIIDTNINNITPSVQPKCKSGHDHGEKCRKDEYPT